MACKLISEVCVCRHPSVIFPIIVVNQMIGVKVTRQSQYSGLVVFGPLSNSCSLGTVLEVMDVLHLVT